VLLDIFFRTIPKPADQKPQDPFFVASVVHEPLKYELGPTRWECVRDRHFFFGGLSGQVAGSTGRAGTTRAPLTR